MYTKKFCRIFLSDSRATNICKHAGLEPLVCPTLVLLYLLHHSFNHHLFLSFAANKIIAQVARPTLSDCDGANIPANAESAERRRKADPQCLLVMENYDTIFPSENRLTLRGIFKCNHTLQ